MDKSIEETRQELKETQKSVDSLRRSLRIKSLLIVGPAFVLLAAICWLLQ